MIDLSLLARLLARQIAHRRVYFGVLFLVIAIIFAQPLLVSAKPAPRAQSQLAELAQTTPTPPAEATDAPEEEATEEPDEEEAATATVLPTEEAPPVDQPNIELPTAAVTDGITEVITVEIPAAGAATAPNAILLPLEWRGDAVIPAETLAEAAPPLQAEISQGAFQIAFVPAAAGAATGDGLRILPDADTGELGSIRFGVKFDPTGAVLPFPTGQTLHMQLSARVYAPAATARLTIADDQGSSSVLLDGLNWNDYAVTRQIAAQATTVEIMIAWDNVPANGWLEVRGLAVALLPMVDAAALSPTDTPAVIEAVTLTPTAPPPATPTATVTLPTATPLVTATPVPDAVSAARDTATVSSTAIISATPTLIVVTATPTPIDVFQEATRVAQATDWARILGPATPTPPNLATATPTVTPIVVTNTPVPANEATAIQAAIRATAIAFTTGTPTPIPANATVLVATATKVPPTATPRATSTPTPIFVLLDDIPVAEPTIAPPVPEILYNKIVFLSSYRGNPNQPNAMLMNPDGTGVGLLTTNYFYNVVAARDAQSSDNRFRVYSLKEAGGEAHNAGLVQLFYDDAFYNSTQHQLTYFGAGVAWAPAWSPTSETIAFVSSETRNDEIWVVSRNGWPATQLTKNDWEWDHHPSYSPDGSQIVFSSNRVTGRRQLWMMSANGEDQRQLTNFTFEAWNPVWVKYVAPIAAAEGCNPNYDGVCIPLDVEFMDCPGLLPAKNFRVIAGDPFHLDSDKDGIACEE